MAILMVHFLFLIIFNYSILCNICIDLKVMLESKNKLLRVKSRDERIRRSIKG